MILMKSLEFDLLIEIDNLDIWNNNLILISTLLLIV